MLPFVVPMDLKSGARVTFKVTVVRDYETWFAFESDIRGRIAARRGDGDITFFFYDAERESIRDDDDARAGHASATETEKISARRVSGRRWRAAGERRSYDGDR